METLQFKKQDGTLIPDVNQYVKDWIKDYPHGEVYIGCDSQEYSGHVSYAVVIVMHRFIESAKENPDRNGKGAHVIISKIRDTENKTPKNNYTYDKNGKKHFNTSILAPKLWKEVELSIEAAKLLDIGRERVKIHIDYNSKEDTGSHMLYASGLGYVEGMGYEAVGKPGANVASIIADWFARN